MLEVGIGGGRWVAGAEGVDQAREVRLPHPSDAYITVLLRACGRAAEAVLTAALNTFHFR